MNLKEAEAMALDLMEYECLLAEGWTFEFDRAVKRMAICYITRKQIKMSKYFVAYSTREQVRQAMLHEIAHALLPYEVGHRKPWKFMAKAIGYEGHRTMPNPYLEALARTGYALGSDPLKLLSH